MRTKKRSDLKNYVSICFFLAALLFSLLAMPKRAFAAAKPPAVKNLKCSSATANSINISWTQQTGVTGYQIYRSAAYDGKYMRIKTITAGNQAFCNMKLTSGKEYYYKVRAYITQGGRTVNGRFSKILTARTSGSLRTATVRAQTNVRKRAGTNQPVAATLKAGTSVTVTCATTDKKGAAWSRISYLANGKKKSGYIRTDLLSARQQQTPGKKKITGSVIAVGGLHLRQSAHTGSPILATLPMGAKVTILSGVIGPDRQKWYLVTLKQNGKTIKGYAAARYIRVL